MMAQNKSNTLRIPENQHIQRKMLASKFSFLMLLTKLVKQEANGSSCDRKRRAKRRLQSLAISSTNTKANLRSTRRWHLHAAQDVTNQSF
jgi:hypothetical protein